jgi:hypothetical protein
VSDVREMAEAYDNLILGRNELCKNTDRGSHEQDQFCFHKFFFHSVNVVVNCRSGAVMSGAARQRNTKIKALVVLEHQL